MLQIGMDNRKVRPIGSLYFKDAKAEYLLLYTQEKGSHKRFASSVNDTKDKVRYFAVPNVAFGQIGNAKPTREIYDPGYFQILDSNIMTNLLLFKSNPVYKREDTVILLGAGGITGEELKLVQQSGYPVVAVNNAINRIGPEGCTYWVGSDPRGSLNEYLEGLELSSVRAFLYSGVQPGVAFRNWKDIGWFGTISTDGPNGLPLLFDSEGVICLAYQFITKILRARKVIMLGIQHPLRGVGDYFWIGIALQAFCYWYSAIGVETWNCTEDSTVVAGVVVGPLEEALRAR